MFITIKLSSHGYLWQVGNFKIASTKSLRPQFFITITWWSMIGEEKIVSLYVNDN